MHDSERNTDHTALIRSGPIVDPNPCSKPLVHFTGPINGRIGRSSPPVQFVQMDADTCRSMYVDRGRQIVSSRCSLQRGDAPRSTIHNCGCDCGYWKVEVQK